MCVCVGHLAQAARKCAPHRLMFKLIFLAIACVEVITGALGAVEAPSGGTSVKEEAVGSLLCLRILQT